ncbi:hypothetical protein NMY22_g19946 [Coprinellus aureogranulatus]|nr:hypothetical protein NMY22_g19946 [Coprinellus aureogranulatus]
MHQPCYRQVGASGRSSTVCYVCWYRKQGCPKPADWTDGEGTGLGDDMGGDTGKAGLEEEKGKGFSLDLSGAEKPGDKAKRATRGRREKEKKDKERVIAQGTDKPGRSAVGKPTDDQAMNVDDADSDTKHAPTKVKVVRKRDAPSAGPSKEGGRSNRVPRHGKRKAAEVEVDTDEEEGEGLARAQVDATNIHGRAVRSMPARRVAPANPSEYPQGNIYQQVTALMEDKRGTEGKVALIQSEIHVLQRNQEQDRHAIQQRVTDVVVSQTVSQIENRKRFEALESKVGKLEQWTREDMEVDNGPLKSEGSGGRQESGVSTSTGGEKEDEEAISFSPSFLERMKAEIKSAVSHSHGDNADAVVQRLHTEIGQRFDSLEQALTQRINAHERRQDSLLETMRADGSGRRSEMSE